MTGSASCEFLLCALLSLSLSLVLLSDSGGLQAFRSCMAGPGCLKNVPPKKKNEWGAVP